VTPVEAGDDGPLGLYVHIPFCEAKCSYCHFAIDPRRPDAARQDRYLAALLREVEAAPSGRADTLYFGGGTPSLLAEDRLARLIEALRARFRLPADAEVTVECNPRDLDVDGFRALAKAGANRASLGLQHLSDAVLAEMGRLHAAADGLRAVEQARAAGFSNLSVDLLLGWPNETASRWDRVLEGVLAEPPEHVSVYVLEVEGRTLLSHRAQRGTLRLPPDDLVADLYELTVARFAEAGLDRYEISNFARRGFESRHNGKYWDDQPFLGFGLSAHSYRDGRRFWNRDTFVAYCEGIETAGSALAGERRLSPGERIQEALFTGLRRRDGIELDAFERRYRVAPLRDLEPKLRDALGAGLLEQRAGRLRLTPRGALLSNEVFQALV
jgi:oxygen-independent coproporphyrinogen-3 oxidase